MAGTVEDGNYNDEHELTLAVIGATIPTNQNKMKTMNICQDKCASVSTDPHCCAFVYMLIMDVQQKPVYKSSANTTGCMSLYQIT